MRLCLFATSQRLVKYKLKGWFITKQNKAELHLSLYGWVCRVWMMDVKLLICSRFLTSLRRAQGQNWIRIFSKAQTTQRIECLILQNDQRKTAKNFKIRLTSFFLRLHIHIWTRFTTNFVFYLVLTLINLKFNLICIKHDQPALCKGISQGISCPEKLIAKCVLHCRTHFCHHCNLHSVFVLRCFKTDSFTRLWISFALGHAP